MRKELFIYISKVEAERIFERSSFSLDSFVNICANFWYN